MLAVIPDGKTKEESEEAAKKEIPVDSAQPNTTIQVRLSDGSTLVARLNHSHTIGDLRRYINMYPLMASISFISVLLFRKQCFFFNLHFQCTPTVYGIYIQSAYHISP